MPVYETVFIARQDLGEAQVEELSQALQGVMAAQGGKVLKTENWGLRTLAYRIKKNRRGHYVLIEHDTPPQAVAELERQMRLNEDVLRALTVKLDAPSAAPSPIIARRDRDEDDEGRKYNKEAA